MPSAKQNINCLHIIPEPAYQILSVNDRSVYIYASTALPWYCRPVVMLTVWHTWNTEISSVYLVKTVSNDSCFSLSESVFFCSDFSLNKIEKITLILQSTMSV